MAEDVTPAPPADDKSTDENAEEAVPQEVLDALDGGVKGELTVNEDIDSGLGEEEEDNEDKEEPEDKPKEAKKDEKPADKEKPDDSTVAAPPAEDKPAESKPDETSKTDKPVVDKPTPTEDPGEFKPADYSFEVSTTDGKTHKITTPEDAETFASQLDDNPEQLTASAFAKFTSKLAVMEQGIAADKREFEANKQTFESQQELEDTRIKTVESISNGLDYLQAQGKIANIPAELDTKDIKWEDHSDNPAIKERIDLLAYMSKDNDERMKHGLEPSFDVVAVYNAMRLENMEATAEKARKAEVKNRQDRGTMVGKPANYTPDNPTPGSIIGLGGSLQDLTNEF